MFPRTCYLSVSRLAKFTNLICSTSCASPLTPIYSTGAHSYPWPTYPVSWLPKLPAPSTPSHPPPTLLPTYLLSPLLSFPLGGREVEEWKVARGWWNSRSASLRIPIGDTVVKNPRSWNSSWWCLGAKRRARPQFRSWGIVVSIG